MYAAIVSSVSYSVVAVIYRSLVQQIAATALSSKAVPVQLVAWRILNFIGQQRDFWPLLSYSVDSYSQSRDAYAAVVSHTQGPGSSSVFKATLHTRPLPDGV